ncbi:MAG: GIY-YIG nuclease family protein [Chlorobi bacterium]|nr:GIY-YIG nuclease family protein [Chlorobiota bacterium]
MNCFTYVIRSLKTGRYYVGSSENPRLRLKKHVEFPDEKSKRINVFLFV